LNVPKNRASAEKIHAAVKASPHSQRAIARNLGVTDGTIHNWVSGWRKPTADHLAALAAVLCVPSTDLIESE
jgi:DNA-binding transcriptional regulator YiaG